MAHQAQICVIKTGGKQYLVSQGQIIRVEKLDAQPGDKLVFDDLLGGKKVSAKVVEHGLAKKINIIKFKPKTRYLRRQGHRQPFTKLKVESF